MKDTMKVAVPKGKALPIALVLSALVLAGVLFWEWNQGLQLQQQLSKLRTIPTTQVPEQKILPEFTLPEAEAGFPELLSRNLFAGNRRSVALAGKAGKGAMKKGQFVLVGVLITPQQRSALLRDVQTNKTETVALVGAIRGITLDDVEATRVVLRQGAETEELILNVQTGSRAGQPPGPSGAAMPATGVPAKPFVPPAPNAAVVSGPARVSAGAGPPGAQAKAHEMRSGPPELPATPVAGSPLASPGGFPAASSPIWPAQADEGKHTFQPSSMKPPVLQK